MERRKGEKFYTTKIGDRLSSHTFYCRFSLLEKLISWSSHWKLRSTRYKNADFFKHSSFRHLATFVNIVLFLNECQNSFIRVPPSKSKLTMLRIKKLLEKQPKYRGVGFCGLDTLRYVWVTRSKFTQLFATLDFYSSITIST